MIGKNDCWQGSGRVFVFALVITPITILLHEFGHLSVAVLAGRTAQLHSASVSGGVLAGDPVWLQAAQVGTGPFVTLMLTAAGLVAYKRTNKTWALALAAAAASRFVTDLGYVGIRTFLFAFQKPFGGNPNFDELVFARLIGLSDIVASITASLVLLATTWLLWRWTERRCRAHRFGAAVLAVIAAYIPMLAWGEATILAV